jgi:hypothetical protein
MTASGRATVRGIEGSEFDVAERVVRDGVLPRPPASLAHGQSWPVAWHQIDGFAAVLFVQRSPYVSRWRRPRFDLLVAELASEGGGLFVCDSVGGKGPGSRHAPFAAPPPVADGLLEGGTATRVTTRDCGEPLSRHALGWGRAGSGVTAVELRTDVASTRVAVDAAGYFTVVATGRDPRLDLHRAVGEPGTARA